MAMWKPHQCKWAGGCNRRFKGPQGLAAHYRKHKRDETSLKAAGEKMTAIGSYRNRCIELESQNQLLVNKATELKSDLTATVAQCADLASQITGSRNRDIELRNEVNDLRANNETLLKKINSLEVDIMGRKTERAELLIEKRTLIEVIERLR